jgi:hypothetical protein
VVSAGGGGGGAGKEVVSKPESLQPIACLHLLSKGAAGRQSLFVRVWFFHIWQQVASRCSSALLSLPFDKQ